MSVIDYVIELHGMGETHENWRLGSKPARRRNKESPMKTETTTAYPQGASPIN